MIKNRKAVIAAFALLSLTVFVAAANSGGRQNSKTVEYSGIRISVPGSWKVATDVDSRHVCSNQIGNGTVALEVGLLTPAEASAVCTQFVGQPPRLGVEVRPLSLDEVTFTPNKVRVGQFDGYVLLDETDNGPNPYPRYSIELPAQRIRLTFHGDDAKTRMRILNSTRGL